VIKRISYTLLFLFAFIITSYAQTTKPKPKTREEKKQEAEAKKKAKQQKRDEEKARKLAIKNETPEQRKARKKKEKEEKAKKKIPENIEVFPKNFLFRPKYVYPAFTFNVTSRQKTGENFNWKAPIPGVVGAALRIKGFYISYAMRIPASSSFTHKYGPTNYQDINISFQGRIVQWGVFYRDFKGFYLNDYQKFYSGWREDSLGFPKAERLHVIESGINLGFSFNKNFSLNAAFNQSERQKKGAGSFLLNVSERYQRIETDTNIVPAGQSVNYPNLDRLIAGDFLTTIISFGGGYQFVAGKFHFTPAVLVGSGIQFQDYDQVGQHKFWINVPTYSSLRAQVGYNGDFFFTNLVYRFEFSSIPIKESRIRLYNSSIEFGLGVRF
jgi:hypothetical protein